MFCYFYFTKCFFLFSSFNLFPLSLLLFGSLSAFTFFLPSLSFCLPACSCFISVTSPGFLFLCDSANSFWSQNTPSSSSIFKIEAIDKDTGSGGSITYFLQVKYCLYLHKFFSNLLRFQKADFKKILGVECTASVYRIYFVPCTRK